VSWQVVPDRLDEMISDPDPSKAARVTQAFMAMSKFDIATLEKAYAGE
jgi:predicted 3-demethylubiquinone-9 3-methyltransferase (glyoxalase superfamily)